MAILLVLATHIWYTNGGYLGVDGFFVLSGYLITSSLYASRVLCPIATVDA